MDFVLLTQIICFNFSMSCFRTLHFSPAINHERQPALKLESTRKCSRGSIDAFVCSACGQKPTHKTCSWKRSLVVAPGCEHSEQQPKLSLCIPLAAKPASVSPGKLFEFWTHVGVQMPSARNITCQNDKPNASTLDAGKKQVLRNREKTMLAVKESQDFDKDRDLLVHFDSTAGERRKNFVTKGTINGTGATREHNHL